MEGRTKVINYVVDCFFLIDIFIIFNSAAYDDDFEVISDRCTLTTNYLQGWFMIDVVAIIPFDLFVSSNGEAANLIRYARIGRITKMLKLMKLMRLMKLQKSSSVGSWDELMEYFKITPEGNWVIMFSGFFFLSAHVFACFYIWLVKEVHPEKLTAMNDENQQEQGRSMSLDDLYLKSFFFIITIFVGFGDPSYVPKRNYEFLWIIFVVFIGIILLSIATGSITNWIEAKERKSEKYLE